MNDTIYDMIDLHNNTVDVFLNFAEIIVNEYHPSDDLEIPVNKSFGEVMQKFAETGIYLCCEANALDDRNRYHTDDNFRVFADE